MNRKSILQSNLLDIIFENRNKDYGAYALRKEYNSRMRTALFSMIGICLFFCVLFFLEKSNAILGPSRQQIFIPDKEVFNFHSFQHLPVKSVVKVSHIKNNVEIDGPPKIVTKININKIPATPLEIQSSSIQIDGSELSFPTGIDGQTPKEIKAISPATPNRPDPVYEAEIMPQYPGGIKALITFLRNNLHSPEDIRDGDEVLVKMKFVVNYDGKLEGFSVIHSGGAAFDREVLRVLKKMPLWIPGKSNGENVAVYYVVPVKFRSDF